MNITLQKLKRFATDWKYAGYVVRTQAERRMESACLRFAGKASPPKMVILQITGACNRTCRMCNQWGESGGYHGLPLNTLTLDLETIRSLLGQVAPFHPYIQILGGEPPLHPQFSEILDLIREHGLNASLETNGTTLGALAEKIARSSIDVINLSIDGPEEVHDDIRGMKGTYRLAIKGLEKVIQTREAMGAWRPAVNIRMTLTEDNCHLIRETVACFRELPIAQFIIQHLLYDHPPLLEENAQLLKVIKPGHQEIQVGGSLNPPKIDGEKVWEAIEELSRPGAFPFPVTPNPRYSKDYVIDYYQDASRLPEPDLICRIPQDVLSISCQGEATICSHFYVGKVSENTVEELWNGELARRFRRLLLRRGSIPACKICCYPTEA